MKRIAVYSAMTVVLAACGNGGDFDATGTFEATEVLVSAEAAGRILSFDVEEGDTLSAGKQVGAIDTVQPLFTEVAIERQRASVHSNRPDIFQASSGFEGTNRPTGDRTSPSGKFVERRGGYNEAVGRY